MQVSPLVDRLADLIDDGSYEAILSINDNNVISLMKFSEDFLEVKLIYNFSI